MSVASWCLYPCYSPLPLLLRGWGRRSVVWELLTCSRTSSSLQVLGERSNRWRSSFQSLNTLQSLFRQRADILCLWIPSKLYHCPHGLRCVYKWERRWECRGLIASAILIPRSANWLRHFRTWGRGGYAVRYTAASIYMYMYLHLCRKQQFVPALNSLFFFSTIWSKLVLSYTRHYMQILRPVQQWTATKVTSKILELAKEIVWETAAKADIVRLHVECCHHSIFHYHRVSELGGQGRRRKRRTRGRRWKMRRRRGEEEKGEEERKGGRWVIKEEGRWHTKQG